MYQSKTPSRTGSVYLVTVITVAAVASMVLIGVKLRTATNEQSALIEEIAESNNTILDTTEYALQKITTDPTWKTTAQSGTIFNDFTLNNTTYTGTVTDADTTTIPDANTTTYRLKLSSTTKATASSATIDLLAEKPDYVSAITSLNALAYWPLNESTGTATASDTLALIDGTYQDPSAAGTSTNDQGALVPVFSQSSDRIVIPWNDAFKDNEGSITLWMKCTESGTVLTYGLIGMQYKSNDEPNLQILMFKRGLITYVGDTGNYDNKMTAKTATNIITLNQWHHIALTWGNAGLTVYLDGVQVAQNTDNTSGIDTARADKGGEQPLKIGAANLSFFGANPQVGFKGSIAHVVFYRNNQLTAAEVAEVAAIKPDLITYSLVNNTWSKVFE